MYISVIVPTYNGAQKIMGLLSSLEKQTRKPDEVIVVIDGSIDNTARMLKTEKFSFNNFRIVEQENKGRAQVRNRGANESSGELLVFFDDDILLPPTSLYFHEQHHIQFSIGLMSGRLEDPNANSTDDFFRFKAWLNMKWRKSEPSKTEQVIKLSTPYLTANNFSISKSTFNSLSGFDSRLKDAEDYDLAVRALKQNIPVFLSRKAFAWHNDKSSCRNYIKRLRQYQDAHCELIRLKPQLYSEGSVYKAKRPRGIRLFFFKLFANRLMILSIENKWWKWLPVNIRYKLYDIIITANGDYFPNKVKL